MSEPLPQKAMRLFQSKTISKYLGVFIRCSACTIKKCILLEQVNNLQFCKQHLHLDDHQDHWASYKMPYFERHHAALTGKLQVYPEIEIVPNVSVVFHSSSITSFLNPIF